MNPWLLSGQGPTPSPYLGFWMCPKARLDLIVSVCEFDSNGWKDDPFRNMRVKIAVSEIPILWHSARRLLGGYAGEAALSRKRINIAQEWTSGPEKRKQTIKQRQLTYLIYFTSLWTAEWGNHNVVIIFRSAQKMKEQQKQKVIFGEQ